MAYGDFKDLPRRAASDKVSDDKAFNINKNPRYDGYQRGLASMVYKFFDKRSSGSNTSGGAVKSEILPNQELAEELHKRFNRKFEKWKVCSSFEDNIWGADLGVMSLISKFNKGSSLLLNKKSCLLCVYYYVLLIFIVNVHGLSL